MGACCSSPEKKYAPDTNNAKKKTPTPTATGKTGANAAKKPGVPDFGLSATHEGAIPRMAVWPHLSRYHMHARLGQGFCMDSY